MLMEVTTPLHLVDGDPCYCCAVFHDLPYREDHADAEVQKDVRCACRDTEHVRFRTLPAVTAVCAIAPTFTIYHVCPMKPATPTSLSRRYAFPYGRRNKFPRSRSGSSAPPAARSFFPFGDSRLLLPGLSAAFSH